MSQSSFLESYPNAGGIRIENRDGVIWVSLTDIGRACGKFFWEWKELESTKKFLNSLGYDRGFKLFETKQGGETSKRGTWAIEEVAIEFANWCYPSLKDVAVAKAVAEIQNLLSDDNPRFAQGIF